MFEGRTLGEEGTIEKEEDVSGSGLGRLSIGIWFFSIESCKVGVDVKIKVEFTSWLHDGSKGTSALEVAENCLDSSRMTLFGIGSETTDL